jgi:hypothetical protein
MAAYTLRHTIHKLIENIEDEAILLDILKLLEKKTELEKKDWWDLISEEEKAAIEEGIAQADRGDIIPHEDVMAKYKKWL